MNDAELWISISVVVGVLCFGAGFIAASVLRSEEKEKTRKGFLKGVPGEMSSQDLENMPTGGLSWVACGNCANLYGATDVTELWCLYVGQISSHAKAQEIVGAVNYRLADEEYQRLGSMASKSTNDILWKRRQYWREYAKKATAGKV